MLEYIHRAMLDNFHGSRKKFRHLAKKTTPNLAL